MKVIFKKKLIEILFFNHVNGITIDNFKSNQVLNEFFDVLATVHNQTTVAAVQGKQFPFYGIQFHPEKNPFVWSDAVNATHDADSVNIGLYFSKFLVAEARKNLHKFENFFEETKYVMNNYYDQKLD